MLRPAASRAGALAVLPFHAVFSSPARHPVSTGDTAITPAAIAHLRVRPTMLSDLDFVVSVEQDERNLPFITPWERTQHEGAIRFPDSRHFIVEAGADWAAAGFVILQGCRNPSRSIELKRLVLNTHGQGLGRRCVRLFKQMAFRDLHAHRFWLDVLSLNTRALHLYASEGFVEEGRLRESVRLGSEPGAGYETLVVMSMLDREYRARLDAALETAPAANPA